MKTHFNALVLSTAFYPDFINDQKSPNPARSSDQLPSNSLLPSRAPWQVLQAADDALVKATPKLPKALPAVEKKTSTDFHVSGLTSSELNELP